MNTQNALPAGRRVAAAFVLPLLALLVAAAPASAQDRLCDPGEESCRDILIQYIRAETVGIDVAFWFMEDARYTSELIQKWQAGVPVRVLVDSRANRDYPINADRLGELRAAGIPMRERFTSGILHWKMMLFAGQGVVQFSGANYSSDAWRPEGAPLTNYTDEVILFTPKASIVDSFRTRYDDLWTNTSAYRDYANITTPLTRTYGVFPKDPDLNFPPGESFANRSVGRYNRENAKIDVIMYRITDQRHTNGLIAARERGVPVRLITEPAQYRDPSRLWHSWNVDRLYMAGVDIKHRVHAGLNHQKSVILHELGTTIFGSSNWTSPSSNSQEEHNLFTTDPAIFSWLVDQFERKWNNLGGVAENGPFVPLPPDAPRTPSPAHLADAVPAAGDVTLRWHGGPWAHLYDVYFGTDPNNLPLVAADLPLGPSESSSQMQQHAISTTLTAGTTYYWQVVAKTMALQARPGPVWRFRTAGVAPAPATATLVRDPYLQSTTSTSAAIVWATRESGPAEVRYAASGGVTVTAPAVSTLVTAASTGLGDDYYQHVARLTRLAPATTYGYDILVNGTDANPQIDSFTTAPPVGSGTVSFIAFGDSGTGSTEQRQLSSLMAADTFDFAVHGGDVAYGNSGGTGDADYATYDAWFFDIYRSWLRGRAFFPALGNHDSRAGTDHGRAYLDLFVLPENGGSGAFADHAERYYSFDYGPVHVVVLDTELAFQDAARRAEQLAWLEDDLASSAQPWKMAVFHRSPFSAGGEHGSDLEVRAAFTPVFEEHGVQLAISAHEHTYERTRPLRGGTEDQSGVTYIVTGGGGAPLYPIGTDTWTAFSASRHHYIRGTASECVLTVNAIGIDAAVFDTVSIRRCEPEPDTTAPSVAVASPSAGSTVRGNATVAVNATDNVGVASVELWVDGVRAGIDTAAPFSFSWDSTTVPNGVHDLQARAFDAAGNGGTSAAVRINVDNFQSGPGDIVLYAADAATVVGRWIRELEPTAAGGALLRNPNAGRAKLSQALAAPSDYFEMTFTPQAGVPYHLWIRAKADHDHYSNDSMFIQFSDHPLYAIGSTESVEYNLEDCSGCRLAGWGWQDNGWGVGVSGPHITFDTSEPRRLRIQPREDGLSIDQIILSPAAFLTTAPGALQRDATIYPRSAGEQPPPADPDTQNPAATITSPADGATVSGAVAVSVSASDNVGVVRVELMVDGTIAATRQSAPFDFTWDSRSAANGAHALSARAYDAAGNRAVSAPVNVVVENAQVSTDEIVLYAADAATIEGRWVRQLDPSAAGGALLRNPNAGGAKLSRALANPADYVELTFTAQANVPYHLWIRARADNDHYSNDSMFIQFSGSAEYAIGSTSSVEYNLEDCSGCRLSGWGWQDNGWGVGVSGPHIVFDTTGPQTLRIQPREDGLSIDQIVLSPGAHLTEAPGALKDDTTILPRTQGEPPPTDPVPGDAEEIVVYASEAAAVSGGWVVEPSATAAGGQLIRHPDTGAPKRTTALAEPVDYFELTVDVEPDVPYHLWIRSRADDDHWSNDSVFLQFTGMSRYGIGTTSAVEMNLEDCSGCGISGWGWQDNGWGVGVAGPDLVFSEGGTQTLRVQTREDGLSIDQIVLSPARYRTAAPGALENDSVILPRSGTGAS